jgi:hypothetical protein
MVMDRAHWQLRSSFLLIKGYLSNAQVDSGKANGVKTTA